MPLEDDLHKMSFEKLGQLFPIVICEHSNKWAEFYQTECKLILDSFSKSDIISIDHIGSTAMPGLKAKPTIDILLKGLIN
jgi:GrpB-like predicted nucleotidyltransferase (UPF0157 family)